MSMKREGLVILKVYMYIVGTLMVLACMFIVMGCRTQYVAVPEYHKEYITRTDTFMQRDSVWHYDSVFVKVAGDTVTIEHWKVLYRDKWRQCIMRDTVLKVDSIRVPYPVERRSTKWEQFKQNIVGALIAFLVIVMVYAIFRIRSHLKG